ncbi:sugar transferase [Planctomycetota bacterium]|nr:sugar transferase [Planctomycetota bacterium]
MIIQASNTPELERTIWGLTPHQLHDRFWAARNTQVVRLNSNVQLNRSAELYLLIDQHSLVTFKFKPILDILNWLRPHLLLLRLHDPQDHGYKERIITDHQEHFIRFERLYGSSQQLVERVALTPDIVIAESWQRFADERSAWRQLRKDIPQTDRASSSLTATIYDSTRESEVQKYMRHLVNTWRRPDATIHTAQRVNRELDVWTLPDSAPQNGTRFVGPVWIGAGRNLHKIDSVVGPAVIWDAPDQRPQAEELKWELIAPDIDPKRNFNFDDVKPRRLSSSQRFAKRAFDIVFSIIVLLIVLPIFPIVMLAIWFEDGRPFFFAHQRETINGKQFPCIKFRSMRNNAEKIKEDLQKENVSDGPHFYIEKDPRHTITGRIIRKLNIDELPQFLNVLLGHMSIVGPRPSPRSENQFCPAWREARLSVRPGITGMWQVYRSRDEGLDFQEWIKYDLQYVENMSFILDVKLTILTFKQVVGLK